MDVGVAFEGGRVLAAVVGAEEQFTTTVEAGPHEGLGPTPVASVGSGQARCQCSVHIGLLKALHSSTQIGRAHV